MLANQRLLGGAFFITLAVSVTWLAILKSGERKISAADQSPAQGLAARQQVYSVLTSPRLGEFDARTISSTLKIEWLDPRRHRGSAPISMACEPAFW